MTEEIKSNEQDYNSINNCLIIEYNNAPSVITISILVSDPIAGKTLKH